MRQQRGLCVALTTEMITVGLAHVEPAKNDNTRSTVIHTSQPSKQTPHHAWKHVSGVFTINKLWYKQLGGKKLGVHTYKWESEVTSLKMPSGSSEISLPWRDLQGGTRREVCFEITNIFFFVCTTALICFRWTTPKRFHWNREGSFHCCVLVVHISGRALRSWRRYAALRVWKSLVSSFYVRSPGRANKSTKEGTGG